MSDYAPEKAEGVSSDWPNRQDPCYDCGSTIPGHHTTICDLHGGQTRDLPCIPGTQYWTETRDANGNRVPASMRPTTIS